MGNWVAEGRGEETTEKKAQKTLASGKMRQQRSDGRTGVLNLFRRRCVRSEGVPPPNRTRLTSAGRGNPSKLLSGPIGLRN